MNPLATPRTTSAHLVGRAAELALLDDAVRRAGVGEPAHVVVAGAAGVGKTRLVREIGGRAAAADALVLSGDCMAVAGPEIPYAPIGAALRQMRPEALMAALDALPPAVLGELAHVFPDLVTDPAAAPRAAGAEDFAQARLFGSLLALLRQLTTVAPVLLVIEDIQWADASSRDFLRFLIHNLRGERLGTVMTLREDDVDDLQVVRRLMDELSRLPVEILELGPLTLEGVEQQLTEILGSPPPPELLRRIFERSEGVPFFVEALALAGAGAQPGLERRLLGRLLLRVKPLSARTQDVLRVVAGAGRPIDYDLLRAAADLDDEPLLAALREAVDRAVLIHDTSTGRYGFRHALLREAVYEELHDPERRNLHARLAAALDARRSAGNAPERAHHWDAAGDPRRALDALLEAAIAAEAVHASGEALRHFRRAAELWDDGATDPERMPMDRVEALARGAEAARISGDYEAATALCLEALDRFEHAEDPVRAAQLYERLGRYHFYSFDAALAAYIEGRRLLGEGRSALRARLLGDEALTLSYMARFDESRDRAGEAIAIAQEVAATEEEGAARVVLGVVLAFLGDPTAGESELRDGLRLAREAGNAEDIGRAYKDLAEVMRIQGRFDAALEVTREGEEVVTGFGAQDSDGSFMAVNAAEDLLRLGRWEEASAQVEALARRRLGPTALLLRESVAGRLNVARGRFDAADTDFSRVLGLVQSGGPAEYLPAIYGGWAEADLWRGDPDSARRRVQEAFGAIGDALDPLNAPILYNVGARAEADARADDAGDGSAEAAEWLLTGLQDLLRQHSIGGFVPPEADAHLAACRAEVARARGEPSGDLWALATSAWERVGQPYPAAYAAWREGEARLLDERQRTAAAGPLRAAAATAERLGAEPLRQRVQRLAEWARLELGEETREARAPAAPAGLTARELQVLRLIAEGLTDRQIAERLVISAKTASHHVSHILQKLNARSRIEAASKAQQLGLLEP